MAGADLAQTVTPREPIELDGRRPAHRRDRHRDQALDHPPAARARLPDDAAALRRRPGRRPRRRSRPRLPRQRPRRPGRARLRRRDGPRAGRQEAGLRDLPRPPAALPGRRPRDLQAARSATAAPTTRSRTSATGRIDITSQNHGFAVAGPGGESRIESDEPVRWETDFGAAELSHLNLYDRTVEGLVLLDVPGGTVQYHPEAGPGPHDARYLFDRFLELATA